MTFTLIIPVQGNHREEDAVVNELRSELVGKHSAMRYEVEDTPEKVAGKERAHVVDVEERNMRQFIARPGIEPRQKDTLPLA